MRQREAVRVWRAMGGTDIKQKREDGIERGRNMSLFMLGGNIVCSDVVGRRMMDRWKDVTEEFLQKVGTILVGLHKNIAWVETNEQRKHDGPEGLEYVFTYQSGPEYQIDACAPRSR